MRVLLRSREIRPSMLESFRELHVLGKWMYADGTLSLAVRTMTFDGGVLLLAFGLLFVQRRRDVHRVAHGAAVAVKVVGSPDTSLSGPRWLHVGSK